MRELKFRAWDSNHKEFILDAQATYDNQCREKGSINHESFQEVIEDKNCIVEQYTGLKDKNGKEIYEGDIVRINGWWYAAGPAGYDENLCAVKWDEEITGFAPFNDYDCDCGVYHNADDCEVIGNIHENQELVKDEE